MRLPHAALARARGRAYRPSAEVDLILRTRVWFGYPPAMYALPILATQAALGAAHLWALFVCNFAGELACDSAVIRAQRALRRARGG
eukprot:gene12022-5553_t